MSKKRFFSLQFKEIDLYKVSIIVPAYNVEKYISTCVKSIKNQTYKNIELLIVDDGSTDNTSILCDKLAVNDNRVKVIHKENGGLSDARNVGIENAKGDYIGFVDSDDWISIDFFSQLIQLALKHNADIVVCERIIVDRNGLYNCGITEEVHVENSENALNVLYADEKYKSHAWNKLYKRELFKDTRFPTGKMYEDIYIMHELFGMSSCVVFIDKGMYYYRQRDDSIVHSNTIQAWNHYIEALYVREKCIFTKGRENLLFNNWIKLYSQILDEQLDGSIEQEWVEEIYRKVRSRYKLCYGIRYGLKLWILKHNYWLVKSYRKIKNNRRINGLLFRLCNKTIKIQDPDKRRIVLMGSPEYNNLGDSAIAYSIKHYINSCFSDFEYIEIPESHLLNDKYPRGINKMDLIILIGGGNFGDLYMDQEMIRKKVIHKYKDNNIIIFPQTVCFTQTELGRKELNVISKAIEKHSKVYVFARERFSYDTLKECFRPCENMKLCPDIVLFNNLSNNEYRNRVLYCIRRDKESALTSSERDKLLCDLYDAYGEVEVFDTCLPYNVKIDAREAEIEKVLELFSQFRLVVTDRLHGVVFSAITGTPCVAISNNNHKIRGICEWTDSVGFIRFVSSLDEAIDAGSNLIKCFPTGSNSRISKELFASLSEQITSCLED